mgnify:FL=1
MFCSTTLSVTGIIPRVVCTENVYNANIKVNANIKWDGGS